MRYIKVLLLVLIFFLSMIFFFQNQAVLSSEMVLHLNLFFIEPMNSIPLPFYFLVLSAFLVGAFAAMLGLMLDRIKLSTKLMQSSWRVRSLEKDVTKLNKALGPQAPKSGLFGKKNKAVASTEQAAKSPALEEKKDVYDDITAPDPDRHQ